MKIDKRVPIPGRKRPNGDFVPVLRAMEIGDSVFVKGKTTDSVRATAKHVFGGPGFVACRIESDGLRVWKIK